MGALGQHSEDDMPAVVSMVGIDVCMQVIVVCVCARARDSRCGLGHHSMEMVELLVRVMQDFLGGLEARKHLPAAEWVGVVGVRERSRHGQEHQAKQAAIKACRPTAVSAGAGPVCSPLLTSVVP